MSKTKQLRFKYKTLESFIDYCQQVILTDNNHWLINPITSTLTEDEFMKDIKLSIAEYYSWMSNAVSKEMYLNADIIKNALEVEEDYYMIVSKHLFKNNIKAELKELNKSFRKEYLNI